MAAAILSLAMVMIAITFPLAISLTTVATERSIAAVAADEAFAKIRLFSLSPITEPNWPTDPNVECVDFRDVSAYTMDPNEFRYPSVLSQDPMYHWSAICRLVDRNQRLFQVTVFVSRKRGLRLTYPGTINSKWPSPAEVVVAHVSSRPRRLQISNPDYINDDYTIVDDETGEIYRVLERDPEVTDEIVLDRDWENPSDPGAAWAVPPSTNGGKGPCIGVFQKVIRF